MEIKELGLQEMEGLHRTQMSRDFPPNELRPFESISSLTQQGLYRSFGFFEGGLAAYATFATPEEGPPALLLDYFAVDAGRRGQGTGTRFLEALRDALSGEAAPYFLIEVESLETAATPAQVDERTRRIRFYKGCGCQESQVYSYLFGVDYQILYLPLRDGPAPMDGEIQAALDRVYHTIVPPLCGPGPEAFQKVCRTRIALGA